MEKQYYIQADSNVAVDIFTEWGIYVKKTEGLHAFPATKAPFSRDWPDEQGKEVYLPTDRRFEDKEVKITFLINKTNTPDAIENMRQFIIFILSKGQFNYFDTLKRGGFRGYYDADKINDEYYRDGTTYLVFEMTFNVPNGICWAYDNSEDYSLDVAITKGTASFYYSTGFAVLNTDQDFVINDSVLFILVVPTTIDGVAITQREPLSLGMEAMTLGAGGMNLGI
jgi:hypothetical protein